MEQWPKGHPMPRQRNVTSQPLVHPEHVYFSPLDIKHFVNAMDKRGPDFLYLKTQFSGTSEAKIKKGIFVGPRIR